MELQKENYTLSTDKDKLDVNFIHAFLTNESGWANGISLDIVKKSIENSFNFGLYQDSQQIGFARVISDGATIAYLGDVFIMENYRGLGLSKWLMEAIMSHQDLQGLRRWILLTTTAEWLYNKYGFNRLPQPEIYIEKFDKRVYDR